MLGNSSLALLVLTLTLVLGMTNGSEAKPKAVLLGNRLAAEVPLPRGQWERANVIDFTSKQMSWIYDWAVEPYEPDRVYVVGGQEDFALRIPPERVAANFLQIASDLRERGIEPVLTTIIPLPAGNAEANEAIAACNTLLRDRCEAAGVELLDLAAFFAEEGRLRPDCAIAGNYLNAAGHGLLAETLKVHLAGRPLLPPLISVLPAANIDPFDFSHLSAARTRRIVEASPEDVAVVMLGDSITELAGDWNTRLDRDDIRNAGQGGYTTGQMLWLLDEAVIAAKPQRVLINGGINDLSIGVPPEQVLANVTEIVRRLKAEGIEPVIQSTFYQQEDAVTQPIITTHNDALRGLADRENLVFIDLNATMSDDQGLRAAYTTDRTHLTEAGYAAWTAVLRDYFDRHPLP
jgi:lysophospholipase L1-like esterase